MNLPNSLTMLRVFLIPVFLVVLLGQVFGSPASNYVAVAIFIVASITDALDGHIARSRNLVTNFGKFMDPLADKLLVSAALVAMVELGLLPSWLVIIIISRDFIITGFRLIAVERGIVIAAGFWGKLKTATQMVMIPIVLLDFSGKTPQAIGFVLIALSLVFTVVSAVEYMYKNIQVLKETGK